MIFSKTNLYRTKWLPFQPFSLQSWSGAPLHLPPALPHSGGHVTRDQSVMTCVTLDDDFHALMSQVTNTSRARLIYLIALARLFRARQQKTQRTLVTSGVMCPVRGRWAEQRSDYDWHLSRDTSAIWHVRWQGITRKIRLGRAGQQIRKIYSAQLKKHPANTWLV